MLTSAMARKHLGHNQSRSFSPLVGAVSANEAGPLFHNSRLLLHASRAGVGFFRHSPSFSLRSTPQGLARHSSHGESCCRPSAYGDQSTNSHRGHPHNTLGRAFVYHAVLCCITKLYSLVSYSGVHRSSGCWAWVIVYTRSRIICGANSAKLFDGGPHSSKFQAKN